MSTYKEQDIENLLAHLREGVAPDSVSALVDDVQIECDGAKEGCASKVQLSSGLAVKASFLAMNGLGIRGGDGIVGTHGLSSLFENLGHLVREGRENTKSVIVEIMSGNEACRERADG